jgi:hypothetical protein
MTTWTGFSPTRRGGGGPDIAGQDIWLDLLERVVRAAERVVRPHGHIMLWYGQAMERHRQIDLFEEVRK